MSVRSRLSSIRKKYLSFSNWMDVDSAVDNARKVGGLFKDLRLKNSKKSFDPNLSFDGWCFKNNISQNDVAKYASKVLKFCMGYGLLVVLLLAYSIHLAIAGHLFLFIYMLALFAASLAYFFRQYMTWALLKMRKMNCSFKELVSWTFSKKK